MSKVGLLAAAAMAIAAASEPTYVISNPYKDSGGILQVTKRSGIGYSRKPSNAAKYKRASLKAKAKKLEKTRRKNRRKRCS